MLAVEVALSLSKCASLRDERYGVVALRIASLRDGARYVAEVRVFEEEEKKKCISLGYILKCIIEVSLGIS